MRALLTIIIVLLALRLPAFDSVAWGEKREALSGEVRRLRKVYSNCWSKATSPATDVTMPIDTFEDGAIKSVIYARKAQYFADSGSVWAEGVVLKKFKQNGELDTRIDAYRCVVDRNSKSGWAEGTARVIHRGTTLTGEGVYFSSLEGYVQISSRSHVVSKDLKFGGVAP